MHSVYVYGGVTPLPHAFVIVSACVDGTNGGIKCTEMKPVVTACPPFPTEQSVPGASGPADEARVEAGVRHPAVPIPTRAAEIILQTPHGVHCSREAAGGRRGGGAGGGPQGHDHRRPRAGGKRGRRRNHFHSGKFTSHGSIGASGGLRSYTCRRVLVSHPSKRCDHFPRAAVTQNHRFLSMPLLFP